jgi:hypothetical protein
MLLNEDGLINEQAFPAFAALAAGSKWYRNATTISDWTSLAVPAILTGRYPSEYVPPSSSAHPESIFSLLGPHYPVYAYESAVRLCPADLCKPLGGVVADRVTRNWHAVATDLSVVYRYLVTPEPWVSQLPNIAMRWSGFADELDQGGNVELSEIRAGMMFEGRMEVLQKFGESIVTAPGPAFHFLHVLLPHAPYEYLPGLFRYPGGWTVPATDWVSWADQPDLVRQARERFMLQLKALDEVLGSLLELLRQEGKYDEALLVLTADHGSSFRPGGPWRTVALNTPSMNDILRVPLFIKLPGQLRGETNDVPAETVDILPTVAGALGMEIPWAVDGESLLPLTGGTGSERVFSSVTDGELNTQYWDPGSVDNAWRSNTYTNHEWSKYGDQVPIIGSVASELNHGPDSALTAELDRPASFQDLDLDHPLRPSLVTGTLNGAGRLPQRVAIAINGIVESVAGVLQDEEKSLFSGLVRPGAFIEGDNEVRLFAMESPAPDGEAQLREILITNMAVDTVYRLDGNTVWLSRNGEAQALSAAPESQLKGVLNTYFSSERSLEFSGWAVDLARASAAQKLVVFESGKPVHIATMEKPVPGLGTTLGLQRQLSNPGFQVIIPRSRLSAPNRPCLRLFAIGHDQSYSEIATRNGGWNAACK